MPSGEWRSFQDEIPGLNVYADEEIVLFNKIVAALAPPHHIRSCAIWEIDQRFFFPKPSRYKVRQISQETEDLRDEFSGDWGSGWNDSPDFLFVGGDLAQHGDRVIIEKSMQLKGLDMRTVNADCEIIMQIASLYQQILYVHDYEFGYLQKVNRNEQQLIGSKLAEKIQTVAADFNLNIPKLFGA